MIYLDNAATSFPKPCAVYDAMDKAQRFIGANPGRSGHKLSLAAARLIMDAREALAMLLGVSDPSRIVFGYNCTDALNLAIKGFVKNGMEVVTSVYSHNSVLRPLQRLASEGKIRLRIERDVQPAISQSTDLVVVPHANNVTGQIEPIEQIAVLCKMCKCTLLVDAAQTAGVLPLLPETYGIDMVAMPGHKALLGPMGTGALYVRPGLTLTTLKEGGTGTSSLSLIQPDELPERYESGTLSAPALAGLAQGVRHCLEHRTDTRACEMLLTEMLICGLLNQRGVTVYGALDAVSRVGTVSFNFRDIPSGQIADELDSENIAVRAGLHCAPLAHKELGTQTQGAVRASLGCFSTAKDVQSLLYAMQRIARRYA